MAVSYTLIISYIYLAFGVFIFLLGLTILRSGGNSPTTRSTALMLFFCGVGPVLSATNIILLSSLKAGSIVYTSMVENFEYIWEFYFPSLFLFSLTFPRENKFIQRYGFLAVLLFIPHIVHLVTIILADNSANFFSHLYEDISSRAELPGERGKLAFAGFGNLFSIVVSLLIRLHRELFSLVNIGYAVLAITFLAKNVKGIISPRITKQLKTVLLGLMISIVTYAFTKIAPVILGRSLPQDTNLVLINFSLVVGGGSIGYAVVRQRFLGIRFIMRKSILYGTVALTFALLYLVVVKPVSIFFGNFSVAGQEAFETGFVILTIIAFQPALVRIEEFLESFLLRGKDDTRAMFKALGSNLMNATNMEELEEVLRQGLSKILDVTSVRLSFFSDEGTQSSLARLLSEIGDPVTTQELLRLKEKAGNKGSAREGLFVSLKPVSEQTVQDYSFLTPELMRDYAVLVPIIKERKCVGFISLGKKGYGMRYSSEELSFLSVLSSEMGVAVESIRLLRENVEKQVIEEELKLARSIQSKLLPGNPPSLASYDLHAVTLPSRYVGGDYYDFSLLDDKTLVVAVADVSGKGIPASLLVATLHAAVRSNEDVQRNPKEMMERINRLLFRSTSPEQFATLFYGVVDLASGEVRYANAGHDFPILLNHADSWLLEESGIVLGCLEEFAYDEYSCKIPDHGGLVLYTDGLTESVSQSNFFGKERLKKLLARSFSSSAENVCQIVLDEVMSFAGESEAQDDLTILVLKRANNLA